jgi:putative Holliday junction resolvase
MLSGEDSPQTAKVREFVTMLENKLRSMGFKDVKVVFQDERFTTKMSEAVLMEAGVRRENRKQHLDRMAAQIILQSYLDTNHS